MPEDTVDIEVWTGDVVISDDRILSGLKFSYDAAAATFEAPSLPHGPLRFLAIVDPTRIPLYLAVGPNLKVTSSSEDTLEWLLATFRRDATKTYDDGSAGAEGEGYRLPLPVKSQCTAAILIKTSTLQNSIDVSDEDPRITEILLYAVEIRDRNGYRIDALPAYEIYALPLSSGFLNLPSTCIEHELHYSVGARFHSSSKLQASSEGFQTSNKERLGNLFDSASDRKKKAKKGARNISLAASRGSETFKSAAAFDSRLVKPENTGDDSILERSNQPNENSRTGVARRISPIVLVPSRPQSRGATTKFEDNSYETRNRQSISRTVMAGMRIYGLQQRKKDPAKPQAQSQSQHPELGSSESQEQLQGDADAEYKAIYHQTYKGAVFTLRHQISSELFPTDAVRDVVDQLLALFCESRV